MKTDSSSEKIPVNLITGFLGSGKTTLLQRLLNDPTQKNTAVLVNEFGEVGLDHLLLQNVTESVLVMENGCVCCAIRGDLRGSLTTLFSQRQSGDITQFKRVIIETSGLADPVPIAYTVLADPILQHHFRMGNIITTIDAVNGLTQLSDFEEPVKQVAVADRLIVTKTDLVESDQIEDLRAALKHINLSAPLFDAQDDKICVQQLILEDAGSGEFRASEAVHWLSGADSSQHDHSHTAGITSFVLNFDQPLDWTAFGIWMTMLLNCHGDKVLRIKGLLNVAGTAAPVLINCVQHVVHQPVHLDQWPNSDRRSRLIFIVAGLQHRQLERSLLAFNKLSNDQKENQITSELKKETV